MDFFKIFLNALATRSVFRRGSGLSSSGPFSPENSQMTVPPNLNRELLYESFISMNSMVFISEMNQFGQDFLEDFIRRTVFVAKELLLEDPGNLYQFDNYQEKVNYQEARLKSALELRNQYFNSDRSMIARELSAEKYKALKSRVHGKLPSLYHEDEDEKYIRMMARLMSAKHEDDGIYRAIQREAAEFYGEKAKIPKSLVLDSNVSLSIGGSVFAPGILASLVKELNVPNISELIGMAVPKLLAPSEELVSKIHLKSFTERKSIILGFLQGCLERKDGPFKDKIDKAFEERTKILEVYLRGDQKAQEKLQILDRLQENEINKLLFVFRNIEERDLILRVDKPVIEAYINLLGHDQKSARESLYGLFSEHKVQEHPTGA